MKLIRFTGSDAVHTCAGTYEVPQDQFERSITSSEDELSRMNGSIARLITALERLTVHIPTSIRMHL